MCTRVILKTLASTLRTSQNTWPSPSKEEPLNRLKAQTEPKRKEKLDCLPDGLVRRPQSSTADLDHTTRLEGTAQAFLSLQIADGRPWSRSVHNCGIPFPTRQQERKSKCTTALPPALVLLCLLLCASIYCKKEKKGGRMEK